MGNSTPEVGSAGALPERVTVLQFHPTAHLTDEQKAWRKVKLASSETEGIGLLVPVETAAAPQMVLPAVAEMLTAGRASDAEAVFAKLRAAGLSLKVVIGADGVLRVTAVGA